MTVMKFAFTQCEQTLKASVLYYYPGVVVPRYVIFLFLPAATKSGQGNIFTSVCQEFCPQGGEEGVCLSACWDTHPPEQTPPGSRHPNPPGRRPPPDQAPPRSRHPPRTRHPPQQETRPPLVRRLQHTVNERPVHILLECILVYVLFFPCRDVISSPEVQQHSATCWCKSHFYVHWDMKWRLE